MIFLQTLKDSDNEFPYFTGQRIKDFSDHSIQYPHFPNDQREPNFSRLNLGNSTNYKFNSITRTLQKIPYPTRKGA